MAKALQPYVGLPLKAMRRSSWEQNISIDSMLIDNDQKSAMLLENVNTLL